MYEELAKSLRTTVMLYGAVGQEDLVTTQLMKQAADAIEKLIEVIQNHDFLESLIKPHWIPVTERLPESVDDDVLVTDGEGYAVGYWRPDAQAWDSTDFGWLENRSEPPCGIHTVTHWMSLPPLPQPPKEET